MRTTLLTLSLLVVVAGCDDGGSGSLDGSDGGGGGDDGGNGDGGAGADGNTGPITGSAGCGTASSIATGAWVQRSINVNGTRDLWVWLPANYDPARAYPVIYELHGCSTGPNRETNNVPVERQVGSDAIAVRGKAASNCWDTATTGPDVPYFDAMLQDVEGAFCVDTSRRFLTGYSSGSFMSHRLGCIRGANLRGIATIAGGQSGTSCTGNVAALLIHDLNDTTVNISASVQARDNHLTRNACTAPPSSTPNNHPPCEDYAGCAAGKGVTWCQTTGMNHSRQDVLAAPIFWAFIQSNL